MPIYEYRCTDCHQLFEEWCKHIEDNDVQHLCPICKGKAERLISHTSFALKGDGWYVTEYGSHKGIKEESAPASCADTACKGGDCAGASCPAGGAAGASSSASASAPAAPDISAS